MSDRLSEAVVEASCEILHNAYEEAAAAAGWETNPASRKPWTEVPEANKATMRVAVRVLLAHREAGLREAVEVACSEVLRSPSQRGNTGYEHSQIAFERSIREECVTTIRAALEG